LPRAHGLRRAAQDLRKPRQEVRRRASGPVDRAQATRNTDRLVPIDAHRKNLTPPMLSRIRHSIHANGGWLAQEPSSPSARRANRRRLFVFLGTLVASLAVSLTYVWIRPPEYRASARVEITPAAAPAPGAASEASRP